ncbi:MAG TPA: SDR family NAD(P)-dependent oxidoreductase, partial [Polyangiaceae bacterium]|nr:SDR family NAD(P)-dependent oxidoreductase [Polyangiaceae bacterium]
YELQFFTNHMGHFMLVTGLLSRLAEHGRVVVVSSSAHRQAPRAGIEFDNLDGSKGYGAWSAYGQSKFANLLFAKELARRLAAGKQTANAIHPGVIRTNLQRHMSSPLAALLNASGPLALKSVAEGAATQVYVATHPTLAAVSGRYFADCNLATPRADADDEALARKLWETSEAIVAKLRA